MVTSFSNSQGSAPVRRRIISVNGRRVHFLEAGSGPPLLLLHPSPACADLLRPLIDQLSGLFTCIAPDAPGMGSSGPPKKADIEVSDLADATAEFMASIGLPACPVFGTHTGAAIGLELGARYPDMVSGLVLDGVPIFTPDEQTRFRFFDGYLMPLEADPLGSHLTAVWTRFRDQNIWFPWMARGPEYHFEFDLPPPEEINRWVTMFYRGASGYKDVYGAALRYGEQGLSAVARLKIPATFFAIEGDMLYGHLDRIERVRSDVEILRLAREADDYNKAIVAGAGVYTSPESASFRTTVPNTGSAIFCDHDNGQSFVRRVGQAGRPELVILHDVPGSAAQDLDLAKMLASDFDVTLIDLPGSGESDPLPKEAGLDDYGDRIAEVCRLLGITNPAILGRGIGGLVALAASRKMQTDHLLLEGFPATDLSEAEIYERRFAPPTIITDDGSHWYRTWQMIRDSEIYEPWFERKASNYRQVPGDFSADGLHARTVEILKQGISYDRLPRAAFRWDWRLNAEARPCPVSILTSLSSKFVRFHEVAQRAFSADNSDMSAERSRMVKLVAAALLNVPSKGLVGLVKGMADR